MLACEASYSAVGKLFNSSSQTRCAFGKMVLPSPAAKSSRSFLRSKRKWPLSPYKGKWQQTFNEQQAMESLKQASATTPQHHNPNKPHLLSALIDSFSMYGCDPTPSAYAFIIKTMTQKSQFDQLFPVLDHLEKFEKFESPEYILVDLIKVYGDANMLQEAIELFFRIPKFRCVPSVYSLNALLWILCKRTEGLQVVHEILLRSQAMNIRLEESTFRVLIAALCKIKKVAYAIELLNLMPEYGYHPDERMYSLILASLCEHGNLSSIGVMAFLEEVRKAGFFPNGVDYTNVIRFLVKEGKGLDAVDALNQMKSDGMKPDVVCYTMVLQGVISAGDYRKAEELFDEMLVLGLIPDVYTYNVYINGLCKQNKIEAGIRMVSYMEDLGCEPNVVTYNTLIAALCKVGGVRKAEVLLKEMGLKGVQGNLHTYRFLIDGLISEDEVSEACGLTMEMLNRGLFPRSSPFDEIVCGLCQRDKDFEALKLLKEIIGKPVAPGPRAWEALLHCSGFKFGSAETTLTMLEDLIHNSPV